MKFSKAFLAGATLCLGIVPSGAQTANYQTVPKPQTVIVADGPAFVLDKEVPIVYDSSSEAMQRNAGYLADYLKTATGRDHKVKKGVPSRRSIVLKTIASGENPESYCIRVSADTVVIEAPSEAGVFYGIQQLRKSLPIAKGQDISLPAAKIANTPRFGYRGAMFDTSRHFFTVDELKTFIDMMALHGMNRFHWHITDDQGWRLEIKKHPRLTEVGSKRKETVIGHNSGEYDGIPYGGYYTQEEARDIVKYAADRNITIIPEIDLPGHMLSVLTAYPELGCTGGPYEVWTMWGVSEDVLCAGNDKIFDLLEDVYSEVLDIFPSEYIHIGGDECPKVRWETCPKCQAKVAELGLVSDENHSKEERLQSYVIGRMERFLNSKGRKIIGWDEILEGGLAPNATVMSWRGLEGGVEAARSGHDAIMVPTTYLYLDYYQTDDIDGEPLAIGGYVPVSMVYGFEPVPSVLTPEESTHIIGVQGNLWTEYVCNFPHAQYMLLPRWAALSELQWMQPETKDYEDFLTRLPRLTAWYDAQGYRYARHVFDARAKYTPDFEDRSLNVELSTIDGTPVYYTLDGTEPTAASARYTEPLKIRSTLELKAKGINDKGEASKTISERIAVSKSSMHPIVGNTSPHPRYGFDGVGVLVDGMKGGTTYKNGRWVGYYGNDMDVTIDLGDVVPVNEVSFSANVLYGDWIFDIRNVSISVSDNGEDFQEVYSQEYPAMTEENAFNGISDHKYSLSEGVNARYVRVKAAPEYNIPEWHPGAGNAGFLFVDEISIF